MKPRAALPRPRRDAGANRSRRAVWQALCGGALLGVVPLARSGPAALPSARAEGPQHGRLPEPASLPALAQAAATRGEPVVLLVSLPGCPYCETARRGYLQPLAREQGAVVAEIDMDSAKALEDYGGRPSTQSAVARRLRIRVAPTVLFLDPSGRELAPRLEGIVVPDFYGAYLEERWRQARGSLRAAKR